MAEKMTETRIVAAGDRFVLPVVLTPGEDGYLVVTCPILPGCISQGRTREEALANIAEAARLTLACRQEEGWDLPSEYALAHVEVPA